MQEKGKGMYYIDLNDKQKSYIYSKCSVKHIKTLNKDTVKHTEKKSDCSKCDSVCRPACRTSCTVVNSKGTAEK